MSAKRVRSIPPDVPHRRRACCYWRDRYPAKLCLECLFHVRQEVGEILTREGVCHLRTFFILTHLAQLSALREVALAKEMHDAGATDIQHLYMGERHTSYHTSMSSTNLNIRQVSTSIRVKRCATRANTHHRTCWIQKSIHGIL
jgi:hypothetical protein